MRRKLSNLLFPARCPFCEEVIKDNEIACKSCRAEIPSGGYYTYTSSGDRCVSPFLYSGMFRDAVRGMKFKRKNYRVYSLAEYLANEVKDKYADCNFDIVTSVPRHKKESKENSNCSKLLAKELASILGAEYKEILVKTRLNLKQHSLPKHERELNVKNAYAVKEKADIEGKRILLCDDIITTGCTLGECCREIKKKKPKYIRCCALCAAGKRI